MAKSSRKINIAYWIITGLFALHYAMGAVYDLFLTTPVRDLIAHLGYPIYFLVGLCVLKLLAVAAILIPGYPTLREWAYAGITFNLLFASYSHLMSGDGWLTIVPLIVLGVAAASYVLNKKRTEQVHS